MVERAPNGEIQPDPVRFPSGMKALADYVHSKVNPTIKLILIKSFLMINIKLHIDSNL